MKPTEWKFTHCEGSKEDLVRDVSRFYSSSHDRFTYGANFINFNLPQFYQIVTHKGKSQVIPFSGGTWPFDIEEQDELMNAGHFDTSPHHQAHHY